MAETSNISRMAEIIFQEIFELFGWRRVGPAETNWACVLPERHNHRSNHPTDVVFQYDDPYSDRTVYVIIDLKSLGRESITTVRLKGALTDLCQTVACAHYGTGWKDKYQVDGPHELIGLLCVYNHSSDYINTELRSSILTEQLFNENQLPPRQRAQFLGPADVSDLHTIANDIAKLRGQKGDRALSPPEKCFYWHPELVLTRLHESSPPAAPLEMLTSDWITMKSENPKTKGPHYTFWYRESGSTSEEFQYLFDCFCRHQMLNDAATTINVRVIRPDQNAASNFEKAKRLYAERIYDMPQQRLDDQVFYNSVPAVTRQFSEIELGFRRV